MNIHIGKPQIIIGVGLLVALIITLIVIKQIELIKKAKGESTDALHANLDSVYTVSSIARNLAPLLLLLRTKNGNQLIQVDNSARKKCPSGHYYSTTDSKGNISYECQPTL